MFEDMLGGFEDLLDSNKNVEPTVEPTVDPTATLANDKWNTVDEVWNVKDQVFNTEDSERIWSV